MKNLKKQSTSFYMRLLLVGYVIHRLASPVMGQDEHEYQPQLQRVAYSLKVPAAILRSAKKIGPTRFYGSFRQGEKTFALHFYDKSRVRLKRISAGQGEYERDSCLDVFQLTPRKTWQRIQNFLVSRVMDEKRDRVQVEANTLWLDPSRKMIPMVYVKVRERGDRGETPAGNQTDIYGVLSNRPDQKALMTFHSYIPLSNSTVYVTEISYPDANGYLTVLDLVSDPGFTSCAVYRWTGATWKGLESKGFENGFETAFYWNGTQFMPFADKKKAP